MSHVTYRRGFSRADLITAMAMGMIVMIYSVALTGCGERAEARRMQNATQTRGLHMSMVLFSRGNQSRYPGFDAYGRNIASQQGSIEPPTYGAAAFDDANPTAMVYAVLLTGQYFTPNWVISPIESRPDAEPGPKPVTNANYSYALLKVTNKTSDRGRRLEWKDSDNSMTPIAGDRSKSIDPALNTTSIHVSSKTTDSADWQGNIVWNDNHVTFETTGKLKVSALKFGQTDDSHSTKTDDLFSGEAVGKFDATTNALFVF